MRIIVECTLILSVKMRSGRGVRRVREEAGEGMGPHVEGQATWHIGEDRHQCSDLSFSTYLLSDQGQLPNTSSSVQEVHGSLGKRGDAV